jgi:hypothetical protein
MSLTNVENCDADLHKVLEAIGESELLDQPKVDVHRTAIVTLITAAERA